LAELDSVTGGTGSSQGGSGSGAGKATFHDISINKEADKSAPTLF
jgi:type VI protein secretion system component Hcp